MDILQEIIRMDKEASERVAAVQSAHEIKEEQAATNAVRNGEEAVINERRALEMFRSKQQRKLDESKAAAEAELKKQTAALDEIFSQNSEQWQDEIMQRITGA